MLLVDGDAVCIKKFVSHLRFPSWVVVLLFTPFVLLVWRQRGELKHVSGELLISPFVMHDIDTSRSALLGAAFEVKGEHPCSAATEQRRTVENGPERKRALSLVQEF